MTAHYWQILTTASVHDVNAEEMKRVLTAIEALAIDDYVELKEIYGNTVHIRVAAIEALVETSPESRKAYIEHRKEIKAQNKEFRGWDDDDDSE